MCVGVPVCSCVCACMRVKFYRYDLALYKYFKLIRNIKFNFKLINPAVLILTTEVTEDILAKWTFDNSTKLLKCCFTSTETVGLLRTGAQDVHLDFHTAPELWTSYIKSYTVSHPDRKHANQTPRRYNSERPILWCPAVGLCDATKDRGFGGDRFRDMRVDSASGELFMEPRRRPLHKWNTANERDTTKPYAT